MILQIVQRVALGPGVGIIEQVSEECIPILPVDELDGLHGGPPWPVRHEWIVARGVAPRQSARRLTRKLSGPARRAQPLRYDKPIQAESAESWPGRGFTTPVEDRPSGHALSNQHGQAPYCVPVITSRANRFRFCSLAASRNCLDLSTNSRSSKAPTQETSAPVALASREMDSSKCGRLMCLIRIRELGTISRNRDSFG